MKKIICKVALGLIISLSFSSCSENLEFAKENTDATFNSIESNLSTSKAANIECRDFVIGVNIGYFYIETEVTICCGYPISGGASVCLVQRMSGKEGLYHMNYNFTQIFKDNGINEKVNQIELLNSSSVILEDGTEISISSGTYSVNENNFVNLDYEIK